MKSHGMISIRTYLFYPNTKQKHNKNKITEISGCPRVTAHIPLPPTTTPFRRHINASENGYSVVV